LPPRGADRAILLTCSSFSRECKLQLRPVRPLAQVYKNPFTVMNSWRCYLSSGVVVHSNRSKYRPPPLALRTASWQGCGPQRGRQPDSRQHPGRTARLVTSQCSTGPTQMGSASRSFAYGVALIPTCFSDYEHLGFPQIVANYRLSIHPTSSAQTSS